MLEPPMNYRGGGVVQREPEVIRLYQKQLENEPRLDDLVELHLVPEVKTNLCNELYSHVTKAEHGIMIGVEQYRKFNDDYIAKGARVKSAEFRHGKEKINVIYFTDKDSNTVMDIEPVVSVESPEDSAVLPINDLLEMIEDGALEFSKGTTKLLKKLRYESPAGTCMIENIGPSNIQWLANKKDADDVTDSYVKELKQDIFEPLAAISATLADRELFDIELTHISKNAPGIMETVKEVLESEFGEIEINAYKNAKGKLRASENYYDKAKEIVAEKLFLLEAERECEKQKSAEKIELEELVNAPTRKLNALAAATVTGILFGTIFAGMAAGQGDHGRGSGDYTSVQISDTNDAGGHAISGDHAFWIKQVSGIYEIWHKDLKTNETKLFVQNATYNLFDVNSENVVYRTSAGIFVKNIDTGIETQVTNNSFSDCRPAIQGDKVVWIDSSYDGNNFHFFIKSFDLTTKEIKTVDEIDSPHHLDIYEHNVIYTNKVNGTQRLLIKDLDNGSITSVGNPNFNGIQPTIYENNVVFVGSEDGNTWFLYKYNIETKELIKISEKQVSTTQDSPNLEGDQCVCVLDNDINVYNITTGTFEKITNDGGNHYEDYPKISNNRIIYGESVPDTGVYLIDKNPQTLPPVNHPPILQDIPDAQATFGTGWSHTPQVSDPDQGDTTNVQVVNGPFEIISGKVVLKDSYKNVPGTYEGKVKVTDSKGASAEDSFKVTVLDNVVPPVNHAPTLENIVGGEVNYNTGWSSQIVASDPDGDPITYQVMDSHFQIVNESGKNIVKLKLEYATQPGDYHTAIKVTDSKGASTETNVDLTVKEKGVTTTATEHPWGIVGGVTALVASLFAAFAMLGRKKEKEVRYYPPQHAHRNGRKPANGNGGY